MYKTFEERKTAYLASAKPKVLSLAEILRLPDLPSSEDRLVALPQGSWTPAVFRDAARKFCRDAGLTASVYPREQMLPPLGPDVNYKYRSEYYSAPERPVAVVMEQERVIGFGIACCGDAETNIEIIDVDDFSRRSAGLESKITLGGSQFGVGVGHVVVDSLISTLAPPFLVDATNTYSRYVFKSLGFVHREGKENPCLLELR